MWLLSLSFSFFSLCLSLGVRHRSSAAVVEAGFLLLCLFQQKEPGQVEWECLSHVVDRGVVIILSPEARLAL